MEVSTRRFAGLATGWSSGCSDRRLTTLERIVDRHRHDLLYTSWAYACEAEKSLAFPILRRALVIDTTEAGDLSLSIACLFPPYAMEALARRGTRDRGPRHGDVDAASGRRAHPGYADVDWGARPEWRVRDRYGTLGKERQANLASAI